MWRNIYPQLALGQVELMDKHEVIVQLIMKAGQIHRWKNDIIFCSYNYGEVISLSVYLFIWFLSFLYFDIEIFYALYSVSEIWTWLKIHFFQMQLMK